MKKGTFKRSHQELTNSDYQYKQTLHLSLVQRNCTVSKNQTVQFADYPTLLLTKPNICAIIEKTIREQTFLADRAPCGVADRVSSVERAASNSLAGTPNNKAQCVKSKKKGYYEAFRLLLANLVKADRLAIGCPPTERAAVRRCFKNECHGRVRSKKELLSEKSQQN